ncbi:hypothetical protein [Chthonobacter albigriseus]|uniref:hypothetical protein n=1 Tax=Chthonobacter albigriseus TaxID=1683161 RepID=UPI0015EE7582|nr:hypothetical protein [Chthonobacter albigriseus]
MLDALRNAIAEAPTTAALDVAARGLWAALAAGMLDEDRAGQLAEALEARRVMLRTPSQARTGRTPVSASRTVTLFAKARQSMPPDRRKSIERRRRLAASGPMPPQLAAHFTTAELACLRIVADEVKAHGVCTRSYEEIAARAGTCRSSARNAIRRAAALRLITVQTRPRPGRKHLPNVVSVVSKEWLAWLRIGMRDRSRQIGGKKQAATDTSLDSSPERQDIQAHTSLTLRRARSSESGLGPGKVEEGIRA